MRNCLKCKRPQAAVPNSGQVTLCRKHLRIHYIGLSKGKSKSFSTVTTEVIPCIS